MENLTDEEKAILSEALQLYIGDRQNIVSSTGQMVENDRRNLSQEDYDNVVNTRLNAVDAVLDATELAEKLGIEL